MGSSVRIASPAPVSQGESSIEKPRFAAAFSFFGLDGITQQTERAYRLPAALWPAGALFAARNTPNRVRTFAFQFWTKVPCGQVYLNQTG
ncbi:hypothetical protein BQ8794_40399 [Mesorhizobium prunaredense]|uniref:Uncharacterized protein n=1 Tax=Mesorhizobium prunaredense TaxID=1631249 RepID=A0A1R3VCY3_9HYPH|nr:hypothetical protein BQ8794_40399 [Mesorhizobium prunaredense]